MLTHVRIFFARHFSLSSKNAHVRCVPAYRMLKKGVFDFHFLELSSNPLFLIKGDLPPKHVPNFKLELCHFLFLNANMPVALGDGNSMNYAV